MHGPADWWCACHGTMAHSFLAPLCTCGLDALLASASPQQGQENEPLRAPTSLSPAVETLTHAAESAMLRHRIETLEREIAYLRENYEIRIR
jgi:hypothetical protein